ncbi:hypothetical protein NA56DRAFT_749906 [Hyaloscypha hepaticicola]|uniref:Uncharacterized protein n=1 Tax=Hyaloscypha hepaticicola TaxID=2082293 RepID=A0A2J6Q2M7_9HELO|nr:hypothetical protein NA56DRAFT_749906 [Hyaloscypha hepaticicola]
MASISNTFERQSIEFSHHLKTWDMERNSNSNYKPEFHTSINHRYKKELLIPQNKRLVAQCFLSTGILQTYTTIELYRKRYIHQSSRPAYIASLSLTLENQHNYNHNHQHQHQPSQLSIPSFHPLTNSNLNPSIPLQPPLQPPKPQPNPNPDSEPSKSRSSATPPHPQYPEKERAEMRCIDAYTHKTAKKTHGEISGWDES